MLNYLASLLIVGALAISTACGQQLLYEETFPYSGPPGGVLPISTAGWANDITNNPNRLFHESGSDGAVFAFQGTQDVPITTAFYTSTALDTGATGAPFLTIDPGSYFCVILSADIRPGFHGDNIEARFCIQITQTNPPHGNGWFAAATPLPVPGMRGPFVTYSQTFRDDASAWNNLTLNGTSATIGGPAEEGATAGVITGAGLVFTHTIDNGTYDFDNFRITASPGQLSITRSVTPEDAPAVAVSWFGAPGVRLQSSAAPHGLWDDVAGTSGKSTATVPTTGSQLFFRLIKD